jgi:hypothetical protein
MSVFDSLGIEDKNEEKIRYSMWPQFRGESSSAKSDKVLL